MHMILNPYFCAKSTPNHTGSTFTGNRLLYVKEEGDVCGVCWNVARVIKLKVPSVTDGVKKKVNRLPLYDVFVHILILI